MQRRNLYYKVLDYPLVQYITLRQEVLISQELDSDRFSGRIDLRVVVNENEFRNYLNYYRIENFESTIDWDKYFVIFSQNYDVEDTKYRTNRIYTFGNKKNKNIQVSSFLKTLLYRNQIYILAYTWQEEKINLIKKIYYIE
jgi:hypothetical protein